MSWNVSGEIPAKALMMAPAIAAWAIAIACAAGALLWVAAEQLRQRAAAAAVLMIPRRLYPPGREEWPALPIAAGWLLNAPSRAPPDFLSRRRCAPPPRQIAVPEDPPVI
jgi:hypothetical protein